MTFIEIKERLAHQLLKHFGIRVYLRSTYGPYLYYQDDVTYKFCLFGDTYDPNIIKEIRSLSDNDLFLDIGANIGIFSILAAQQSPQVKVIAFEPNKTIFQTLNHNISRNNLNNIYPFNAAISSIDGEASLNIDNRHTGKSYIQTQQGQSYNILSLSKKSLSFLKTLQFNKGIIKIDVEGCEAQVLTALDPIISMENIKTVIIEISTEQLARFQTTKEDIYAYFKQKKMHPQHQYQKDHYDEIFKKP